MALPLIPVLLGASSIAAGAWGLFKGGKAIADNNEAEDVNSRARRLRKEIANRLKRARDKSKDALERLGKKKLHVCEVPVKMFVALFDKIKNVELAKSDGMDELGKFTIDKQNFKQLKETSELATSFASGSLGGAVAGGAVAFGAYSAAGALASASTGTAIAGLSGAAATNATLAFFGGGSLAAGGLGMAGGMAVLGGVVAGPALLVLGSVMGAKASENLDNAYSNLAKVREAEAEVDVMVAACNGIYNRADIFTRILVKLEFLVLPQIQALAEVVRREGTDYLKYSESSKKGIAALLSTMKAIKAILDTPLLTDKGALTKESKEVVLATNKLLGTNFNPGPSKSAPQVVESRVGINPATGEKIIIPARSAVKKAPAKKSAAKKWPAKKAAVKKASVKKAPAKKAQVKKTSRQVIYNPATGEKLVIRRRLPAKSAPIKRAVAKKRSVKK